MYSIIQIKVKILEKFQCMEGIHLKRLKKSLTLKFGFEKKNMYRFIQMYVFICTSNYS